MKIFINERLTKEQQVHVKSTFFKVHYTHVYKLCYRLSSILKLIYRAIFNSVSKFLSYPFYFKRANVTNIIRIHFIFLRAEGEPTSKTDVSHISLTQVSKQTIFDRCEACAMLQGALPRSERKSNLYTRLRQILSQFRFRCSIKET